MNQIRALITKREASWGAVALRQILRPLGMLYRIVIRFRNLAYDWRIKPIYESRCVVFSIGNLSVGGTGKSPMVAWLAALLRAREQRVAVLSRGYGELDCGRNDEALELEMRFPDVPHLQSPNRVESSKLAEYELEMEVLILDDGFQHRKLSATLISSCWMRRNQDMFTAVCQQASFGNRCHA